jgi:hypothetical protein
MASCAHQRPDALVNREVELIHDFKRKYAEFLVTHAPQFTSPIKTEKFKVRQTVAKSHELELQLALGERWSVASNAIYRSESRYRLVDAHGRLLAAAESTLATGDIELNGVGWVTVFTDAETNSFFIAEEQSWATQRYILIYPAKEPELGQGATPKAWTVEYVRIPQRGSTYGLSDPPRLLGIRQGRLYFLQDGKTYAIPFEKLTKAGSLEYSIG